MIMIYINHFNNVRTQVFLRFLCLLYILSFIFIAQMFNKINIDNDNIRAREDLYSKEERETFEIGWKNHINKNIAHNAYLFSMLGIPKRYENTLSLCRIDAEATIYKRNINAHLWDRYPIFRSDLKHELELNHAASNLANNTPIIYGTIDQSVMNVKNYDNNIRFIFVFDEKIYEKKFDTYEEYVLMSLLRNETKFIKPRIHGYIPKETPEFIKYKDIFDTFYGAVNKRKNMSGWLVLGYISCFGADFKASAFFISDNGVGDLLNCHLNTKICSRF
jgi:hypothetical protein